MRTEKVEKTVKLIPEEKREIYFRDTVLDNNELIVPAAYDALIFEIDIETLQWKSRKMGQYYRRQVFLSETFRPFLPCLNKFPEKIKRRNLYPRTSPVLQMSQNYNTSNFCQRPSP